MVIMQGGRRSFKRKPFKEKVYKKTAVEYSLKARQKGVIPALFMTHAYLENDYRFEPNLIQKLNKPTFKQVQKVAPLSFQ